MMASKSQDRVKNRQDCPLIFWYDNNKIKIKKKQYLLLGKGEKI